MFPLDISRIYMGRKYAMCEEALGNCWAVNRLSSHSAQILAVVSPFGIVQDDNFCFLINSHYFFPFDGVGGGGFQSLRVVASGHFHSDSFCLIFPGVNPSFACFLNGLLPQYSLADAQAQNEVVFLHVPRLTARQSPNLVTSSSMGLPPGPLGLGPQPHPMQLGSTLWPRAFF